MAVNASNGRTSLADRAYDIVEAMIVTLELEPGSVFSESELSERIGIGRTPLREALQRLSADRLVVSLPRRGMMVTDLNATEYFSLLETRRELDRLIAIRASSRRNAEQRDRLSSCAGNIRAAARQGDVAEFMRLDRACDDILKAAARNPFAVQAAAPLHAHCRRFWSMFKEAGDLERSAKLHAEMMTSVAAGDPERAAEASDGLIDYLESFTREALELI